MTDVDFRRTLEEVHGETWNTDELQRDFVVMGFSSGFVVVTRKTDDVVGSLHFDGGFGTAHPDQRRVYYAFVPDRR